MKINELLDTIERGLSDIQNEVLANLDMTTAAQRTKPVEVRLRELETRVARMKFELSGVKSTLSFHEMRLETARDEASRALAEVRQLAGQAPRPPRRKRS